jgi:hypothetical protein
MLTHFPVPIINIHLFEDRGSLEEESDELGVNAAVRLLVLAKLQAHSSQRASQAVEGVPLVT